MAVDTSRLEAAVRRLAVAKVRALGEGLQSEARSNASRRSGKLADSIEVETPRETGSGASCRVFVGEAYGRFQDEGTGIYGPEGTPIRPRSGNVLVFDWPAAGGVVFARSVRGSEPTRFWRKAIEAWPRIVSNA